MARRRRHEEPENHERWLVSYADFITLLFAFFVVMYSISSVNEGKYRVLSNTLTEAFVTSAQSLDPIQIGEPVRTAQPQAGSYVSNAAQPAAAAVAAPEVEVGPAMVLAEIADELAVVLNSYIDRDLVRVTQTEQGVEVEMKSKMLFSSGHARLSAEAQQALRQVAKILQPLPNQIKVEGHTDNIPINTPSFPSNWELSAARAASVVHLFARLGVKSERMAAIGYGEFQPIANNALEQGRQANRRVSLVIMAGKHERSLGEIGPRRPWGER